MRILKSAFIKDGLRQVRATIHRFLAILVITALGVAFFAGLRASGPDMRITASDNFDRLNFMDIRLLSTIGFNQEDLDAIKKIDGVRSVMPAYSLDALAMLRDNNLTVRLHSLSGAAYGHDAVNRPELVEGRMPECSGECLADPQFMELSGFSIGDTVHFVSGTSDFIEDTLKSDTFTIVGIAENPLYISDERGSSTVGSGKADAYFLILPTDFEYEVYTEIYLTVENPSSISRFDNRYEDLLEPVKTALEETGVLRSNLRYKEILSEGRKELDDAKKEVEDGYRKLADAEKELEDARIKLDEGWLEYYDGLDNYNREIANAQKKLDDAKAALEQGWQNYYAGADEFEQRIAAAGKELPEGSPELEMMRNAGRQELEAAANRLLDAERELVDANTAFMKEKPEGQWTLDKALEELNDGETEYLKGRDEFLAERDDALKELESALKKIDDGEKELSDLDMPKWYALDLETNIGFLGYKDDAERVEALSLVIPVLFFLVAVLVTMTSMTRLVDSDRPYIGTMRALGYGGGIIALRYLLYAVSASFLGSVLGLAAGLTILPRVIFNAYAMMYTLPPIQVQFLPALAIISTVIAVACAALPAWFVCLHLMREVPAELMRPVAPRIGKKILLERVGFIWRKLNFSRKVALRNLFRYKKRLYMTVIGVAGCTALMFTGFGLRDSVTTIVPKQYEMVQSYDLRIDLQQNGSAEDMNSLEAAIEDNPDIDSKTRLTQETVDAQHNSKIKSAFLTVPEVPSEFPSFLRFKDRLTNKALILGDESVLITEKLSNMLNLAIGDIVTVRNADGKEADLVIGGVTENYLYHYVFMSPSLYRSAFGSEPSINQILCHLRDTTGEINDDISASLLEQPAVSSVSFTDDLKSGAEKMVGALHYIVLLLIFSAAALVFVVLFSLTSISLEERSRELATIKVLGFFNRELAAYIYRENVVLTVIGTGAGLLLGVVLQRYIITTMEVDMLMFSRDLLWQSYVFSAVLTFFFAGLVNIIMFRYVAKIDMVSSLKSIE